MLWSLGTSKVYPPYFWYSMILSPPYIIYFVLALSISRLSLLYIRGILVWSIYSLQGFLMLKKHVAQAETRRWNKITEIIDVDRLLASRSMNSFKSFARFFTILDGPDAMWSNFYLQGFDQTECQMTRPRTNGHNVTICLVGLERNHITCCCFLFGHKLKSLLLNWAVLG